MGRYSGRALRRQRSHVRTVSGAPSQCAVAAPVIGDFPTSNAKRRFADCSLLTTSPSGDPGRSPSGVGSRTLDDRFHETGIEETGSMELEGCWWIPRLRLAERGAVSWQDGVKRSRWR